MSMNECSCDVSAEQVNPRGVTQVFVFLYDAGDHGLAALCMA